MLAIGVEQEKAYNYKEIEAYCLRNGLILLGSYDSHPQDFKSSADYLSTLKVSTPSISYLIELWHPIQPFLVRRISEGYIDRSNLATILESLTRDGFKTDTGEKLSLSIVSPSLRGLSHKDISTYFPFEFTTCGDTKAIAYLPREKLQKVSRGILEADILHACEASGLRLLRVYADDSQPEGGITHPALRKALTGLLKGRASTLVSYRTCQLRLPEFQATSCGLDTASLSNHLAFLGQDGNLEPSLPVEALVLSWRLKEGRKVWQARRGCGSGKAPYGWTKRDGRLVPDLEEQEMLARINEAHAAGLFLREIADILNLEKFKTRTGKPFSPYLVHHLLHSQPRNLPPTELRNQVRWQDIASKTLVRSSASRQTDTD